MPVLVMALALSLGLLGGVANLPAAAQDPAAERLLASANRLERDGNPAGAIAEYSLLAERFPQDRLAPRALLRIAELQRASGDPIAAQTAQRLESLHPRSTEAAEASLIRMELDLAATTDRAGREAALNALRRLPLLYGQEAYPVLSARARALRLAGELGLELGDAAAAAADFLAAAEDEPLGSETGLARWGLAEAWLRQGETLAATEVLQRLADTASRDLADRARRRLALVHKRLLVGRILSGPAQPFAVAGMELRGASGIVADESGQLLVVDEKQRLVLLVGADGRLLQRRELAEVGRPFWTPEGQPYLVARDALVAPFSGSSQRFDDPRSQNKKQLQSLLAASRGVLGTWLVIPRGGRELLTFGPNSAGRSQRLGSQSLSLQDVARDAAGRVYLLDKESNRVLRLGPDLELEMVAARGPWRRPVAVAADALGYVFVLDRGERRVSIYDPQGQQVAGLGPDLGAGLSLRSPEDLTVDGAGRLWIVDSKLPTLVRVE